MMAATEDVSTTRFTLGVLLTAAAGQGGGQGGAREIVEKQNR